jgi:hypothetical protein
MNEELGNVKRELTFMYKKYEELCKAYKKLAEDKGSAVSITTHDMSHMTFKQDNKEMM